MKEKMKVSEFADLIGVCPKTLRNWDNSGKLKAYRTITNYRYYTQEHYAIVCSWRLTKVKREEKKKNAKTK